jgi:hypothetical protein
VLFSDLLALQSDPPLESFLQYFTSPTVGFQPPVAWRQQLGEVFEAKLTAEDVDCLVQWLSQQKVVVEALAGEVLHPPRSLSADARFWGCGSTIHASTAVVEMAGCLISRLSGTGLVGWLVGCRVG